MKRFAIYFPQFHKTKSNDSIWGFGFNDWHLVSYANAFSSWDKRAPKKGFYDLSDKETIRKQFSEANSYGLDGFGIYHYYFKDGPELNTIENYLKNNSLNENFNLFLIWANENWSTRWSGKIKMTKEVFSDPTDIEIEKHVDVLTPIFRLKNYQKFRGKNIFVVYRPENFIRLEKTLEKYKKAFQKNGLDVSFGYFIKNKDDQIFQQYFDFCYIFEPRLYQNFYGLRSSKLMNKFKNNLVKIIKYENSEKIFKTFNNFFALRKPNSSYKNYLKYFLSQSRNDFAKEFEIPFQEVLSIGWDNTPRYRNKGIKILETPSKNQIRNIMREVINNNSSDLPLLCNAWNEWSEGAAIEPCNYFGDYILKEYVRKIN